jgi:hypothetical protein
LRFGLRILMIWLCGGNAALAGTIPAVLTALSCGAAGRAAEQAGGLPANLLVSIGYVESGRADPASGQIAPWPWPWTVNVDGAGYYFDSEQDAAAFARGAEASGASDVDVGCFQISLENHPDAFASLDDAFDPAGNADFAAHFLNQLKTRSGSWEAAIADYHSAVPALGLPYQRRVLSAWRHLGQAPADMLQEYFSAPDPTVILEAPAARLVRVITLDGQTGPPVRGWLPRVITP